MKKEKKIYDKDIVYTILRPYVDRCIRMCYRKAEITGEENLPSDGALILTPNHCNTLMDALVMLRAHKGETVFGARADLFNKPFIARIMFFLRILPMVRQRDGLRNVLKNHETQETIVETIEHGIRFCVYPEGRHRPEKSLLPLGKGVFRAALAANTEFGDRKPVYIVPVGLEYGDFFRVRSTSLVNYGQPINVTEYVRQKSAEAVSEASIIDSLKKELTLRMSELFTYIKNDENLSAKWSLTKMLYITEHPEGYGNFRTGLKECMLRNRAIVAEVEKACEERPEEMESLLLEVEDFEKHRRRDRISIYSFSSRNTVLRLIGKAAAALLGLPYFIFCAAAALPMWVSYYLIKGKIKDRAFHNTVGLGVRLTGMTVLIPLYAIIAFCTLSWPVALAITLAAIPAYSFFFDYVEGIRRFVSDLRIKKCNKLRKQFNLILNKWKSL